jgi:drug/metabolite transporter (DMT)-like permease
MTLKSPRSAALLLVFVSFVWGVEFVLVDKAIETIPTHTFNGLRFLLAALCLLPLWYIERKSSTNNNNNNNNNPDFNYSKLRLLLTGAGLGLLLFIGFATQTEGMRYTSVSNAGFITGLNVPFVPLLGFLLFRDKLSIAAWIGIFAATMGLYLLTVGDKLAFNSGDLLVLICAVAFAAHIIATGRTTQSLPTVSLSIIQMSAVALYSGIAGYFSNEFRLSENANSLISTLLDPIVIIAIATAAVFGSALAYWAQTASQKILAPHQVALIFALEPLFAHTAAVIFLNEMLGFKGWIGAGLILAGMLIAELGDKDHPPEMIAPDHSSAPKGY